MIEWLFDCSLVYAFWSIALRCAMTSTGSPWWAPSAWEKEARGSLFLFLHEVLSFVSRAFQSLLGFDWLHLKASYMHLFVPSGWGVTNSKALLQQFLYFWCFSFIFWLLLREFWLLFGTPAFWYSSCELWKRLWCFELLFLLFEFALSSAFFGESLGSITDTSAK